MSTGPRAPLAGPLADCRPAPPWPDDAALAVCVDTMVEGVHFPADTAPQALAHKLLAVNLSDLAAMGAEPTHALLAVAASHHGRQWRSSFRAGLAAASACFDTPVRSLEFTDGPLTLTAELHGRVPVGTALTRGGARAGDLVFVTGSLGDAAAALAAWRGDIQPSAQDADILRARLDRPTPRLAAGLGLRALASACIDVSDGLAADLGHILATSGVGATLRLEQLPLSAALLRSVGLERALALAVAGGDDYELCFCLPAHRQAMLAARMPYLGCAVRCIGSIDEQPGLRCVAADGSLRPASTGWMHFGGAEA